MKRIVLGSLAVVLTFARLASAEGQPSVDKLVENVIQLRGEVEGLDNQIRERNRDREARMAALLRQESELTAERQRQELRWKKLEQQLALQHKTSAAPAANPTQLAAAVEAALDEVRTYVTASLPFKREDRLAALDQLRGQLRDGTLEPARAANQLWAFIADELQLCGEVGLYRQPIAIEGDNKLVDVARVGMMNLYFRTDDDRVGLWVPGKPHGSFHYADGPDQDRIRMLIGALRTNVRSGYFELPTPQSSLAKESN